ncbi:UDP-glucuronosyltransferase 2A3 [Sciurus carolinensis]|uniref:UDP-glucuronosyltransferase 2A3 n=1 Tax=Sciurus carolinensis TaxID=30640 RepID=A0AA41MUC9_SCICA|nr:UDP-glucuronosyltransferase 2A3 [Sciurus carolinensis]
MMFEKWVSTILLLQFCCVGCGFCGKVLVWPCEMSHWLNLKTILEELLQRGHEVTILTSSQTFLVDYHKPSAFNFEVIFVSGNQEDAEKKLNEFLDIAVNIMPTLSLWESANVFQNFFLEATEQFEELCRKAVYNESLMEKLRETKYDVMVIDPMIPCGELVAELLGVPFVNTIRLSMGNTIERYCGHLPVLPSYVPVSMGGLTDRMTFMERVKNMMFTLFFDFVLQQYDFQFWDQLYSEALGRPTTLCETMGKAEIWLIRTYWDFEFPRPYLPNFEFVGGLHCKPAKPLPKEMQDFVQSSGEDGIVVFSLGSMVKNLTEEKANFIASALAQLPQKVLWRYKGKKPATLGANTRIFDWLPQNDLLDFCRRSPPPTQTFIKEKTKLLALNIPSNQEQLDQFMNFPFQHCIHLEMLTSTRFDVTTNLCHNHPFLELKPGTRVSVSGCLLFGSTWGPPSGSAYSLHLVAVSQDCSSLVISFKAPAALRSWDRNVAEPGTPEAQYSGIVTGSARASLEQAIP